MDDDALASLAAGPGVPGRVASLARTRLTMGHPCVRERYGAVRVVFASGWTQQSYGKPGSTFAEKTISVEWVRVEFPDARPRLDSLYYSGGAAQTESFRTYEFHKSRPASVGFVSVWKDLKSRLDPAVVECLTGPGGLRFVPKNFRP